MGSTNGDIRHSFETFKSNVCHRVKYDGAIDFIIDTLEKDTIREYFNRKWYPEALYLLAMVDYLSRKEELPLCKNYDDIRQTKLQDILFPIGVILLSTVLKSEQPKLDSIAKAIPEFLRFNIVESEIENVV